MSRKIGAEAVGLCFIETVALFEIAFCGAEDCYPETFILILSLASSQLDTVTFSAFRAVSRSLSISPCHAGDSSFS